MWPRALSLAVGIWLIAAPRVLGYRGLAADLHWTIGPTIAAVSVVAMSEVMRPLRFVNSALALVLMFVALMFAFDPTPAVTSFAAGLLVLVLSTVRGRIRNSFGGGWSALRQGAARAGAPSSLHR